MKLSDVKPEVKERVIDLVEEAGIPTANWALKKNGQAFNGEPATNPNYCYEWSFRNDSKKIALVNIWYEHLVVENGRLQITFNIRKVGDDADNTSRKRRAVNMDSLLRVAALNDWTIRTIIMDGRQVNDGTEKASKRILDTMHWHIKQYDNDTGECVLVRGLGRSQYVDQFDLRNEINKQKIVTGNVYERSETVRRKVLERAAGRCEFCDEEGFLTTAGRRYLETHHIEPLFEGGLDEVDNVIALCPHHHRYAHYSENSEAFKKELFECLNRKMGLI